MLDTEERLMLKYLVFISYSRVKYETNFCPQIICLGEFTRDYICSLILQYEKNNLLGTTSYFPLRDTISNP